MAWRSRSNGRRTPKQNQGQKQCMILQVGVGGKAMTLLMVGLDNAGKTCTAKTLVGQVAITSCVQWMSESQSRACNWFCQFGPGPFYFIGL